MLVTLYDEYRVKCIPNCVLFQVSVKKANWADFIEILNSLHFVPFLLEITAVVLSASAAAMDPVIRFSGHTLDKATKAKVTLENYYSNLISQHRERKHR